MATFWSIGDGRLAGPGGWKVAESILSWGMAVTLLPLADGNLSLEFAQEDMEAVRQTILDLFGETFSEQRITYSLVAFGGESFLFEHEWDSPCLIASTQAASRMLMKIEQRLSGAAS